jgi:hypothetical protein
LGFRHRCGATVVDEPRVPREAFDLEHVMLSTQTALGSVHTRNAIGQSVIDILVAWASSR